MNKSKNNQGFTLMEVVVSVTIFAGVITLMLGLFNQTLRIYRRTEAIRQTTQNVRSVMEFLVKEVRNGSVYYGLSKGGAIDFPGATTSLNNPLMPCVMAQSSDQLVYDNLNNLASLSLINVNGERECIYWQNQNLYLKKEFITDPSQLNPTSVRFTNLRFLVYPEQDPYANPDQQLQPSVSVSAIAETTLPTGEIYRIPYQTSVSTYNYDIPTNAQ